VVTHDEGLNRSALNHCDAAAQNGQTSKPFVKFDPGEFLR
jgi:hypothetical protein